MENIDYADRRIVLLLGTPRSGSTWLANILNSYRKAVYSHEALSRLRGDGLRSILETIKRTGCLSREDRSALIWEWSRAHHDVRRPPFFGKDFRDLPSPLMLIIWLSVRGSRRGQTLFRMLFSPRAGRAYDILIKEVDWAIHARAIVSALEPDLIVIYRHPCAVVASQLRGTKLGLLPYEQKAWLEEHVPLCEGLGFDRRAIERMEDCEFLALQWLISNTTTLRRATYFKEKAYGIGRMIASWQLHTCVTTQPKRDRRVTESDVTHQCMSSRRS